LRKPRRCPNCGSDRIVRIVYGLPPEELAAAEARGELILGGCMSSPASPTWGCAACHWKPDPEPEPLVPEPPAPR